MDVSIIIRFKNEDRLIGPVLQAVTRQRFPDGKFEILAVDNCSTDQSRQIAERYAVNIIEIDDYQPGFALNTAIKHTNSKYIAVLSAHTIPANNRWLGKLYDHMSCEGLLGVYGAQLYPANSRFLSKCVLDRFSTLESRTETVDSDFWNANSMFSREVWEQQPFDEDVFELEDHYWAKQQLPRGFHVIFEPEALVYHYSHLERLDRQHLPISKLTDESRIRAAIRDLENFDSDWPTAMQAGLTLTSLSHAPQLREAVDVIGRVFSTHLDFDLRWRLAYVLGKIRNRRSVEYLVQGLSDPSLYPRDAVAWSLGRLGTIAVEPLLARVDQFTEIELPFAALALGLTGEKRAVDKAVELLISEMNSGSTVRRVNAIYSAGTLAEAGITSKLVNELNLQIEATHKNVLRAACWALGCHARFLCKQLSWRRIQTLANSNPDPLTRFEATVALGKHALVDGSPYGIAPLIERLLDSHSRVRYGAVQSLRLISEARGIMFSHPSLRQIAKNDFGCAYELSLIEEQANRG